jgi:hypothetical protein
MEKKPNLATCDLAEVFAQLEKADFISLQKAQVEIAREQDRKRQEAESETIEHPDLRLYSR